MKLFAIVSCFPSFFESDKESNIFEPVIAPKRSRDTKDTGINHNSIEFSDVSLGHKCYYDSLTPSSTPATPQAARRVASHPLLPLPELGPTGGARADDKR